VVLELKEHCTFHGFTDLESDLLALRCLVVSLCNSGPLAVIVTDLCVPITLSICTNGSIPWTNDSITAISSTVGIR